MPAHESSTFAHSLVHRTSQSLGRYADRDGLLGTIGTGARDIETSMSWTNLVRDSASSPVRRNSDLPSLIHRWLRVETSHAAEWEHRRGVLRRRTTRAGKQAGAVALASVVSYWVAPDAYEPLVALAAMAANFLPAYRFMSSGGDLMDLGTRPHVDLELSHMSRHLAMRAYKACERAWTAPTCDAETTERLENALREYVAELVNLDSLTSVCHEDRTTDPHGRLLSRRALPTNTPAADRYWLLLEAQRSAMVTDEMFSETAAELILAGAAEQNPARPVTLVTGGRGAAERLLEVQLEASDRRKLLDQLGTVDGAQAHLDALRGCPAPEASPGTKVARRASGARQRRLQVRGRSR